MPHDHPHHHHGHDHGNGHGHGHHHHDHAHDHRHGHNHPDDHLHSHMHTPDLAAELQLLTDQFIDGFVQAKDKMSYLRLSGVPLEKPGTGGGPSMKLVDVRLTTEWQVGTASPSFGSRELSYLPFPGEMISERTNMGLVYVSLEEKQVDDIREVLRQKAIG
jgi:hypothetical protein